MNKKLTAKIQKLIPALGETEAVFSSSIAIEPTEKDLILRKGNVYTVFDIASTLPLNVSLLSKVVNDVLYESYYHSDSVSPIQSLEKAVVNINEKLSTLVKQVVENEPSSEIKLEFNILTGVLWGNVLYVVQYGKGKSFYMREGDIKEIESTSEGNFSVASGVVNPNDVIVLNTLSFTEKFPPDKLLGTALSSNDLEPSQSCMILKFLVDTEFTEDEVVDFNLPKEKKSSRISVMLEGLKNRRGKKEAKIQPIETLADIGMETTPAVNVGKIDSPKESPNIKIKSSRKQKIKINSKSLLMVFFILLIVSVFTSIIIKNNKNGAEEEAANATAESSLKVPKELNKPEAAVQTPTQNKPAEEMAENNVAEDLANKVSRIDTQPFYDIKLADEAASPKNIAVFSSTVVVSDPTSGKIFTSNVDTPKFAALETSYPGIKNLVNYDGKLNFTDSSGYKILNLADDTVTNSFAGTFGVANVYLGNVYSVADGKITKFVKSGDKLEESTWGENTKLADVTAIDVAYSIYTTTKSGDINVYTQGELANFKITGLDVPLLNPVDIETDVNFDYIYVADAGNKRIVVLKSNGEFVRQLKAVNESEWDNLLGITVSSDEKMMYVLNGSKVFDVDLEEAMKPLVNEAVKTEGTADTAAKEDVVVDGTAENTPVE